MTRIFGPGRATPLTVVLEQVVTEWCEGEKRREESKSQSLEFLPASPASHLQRTYSPP